jgi:hypothetical protein
MGYESTSPTCEWIDFDGSRYGAAEFAELRNATEASVFAMALDTTFIWHLFR